MLITALLFFIAYYKNSRITGFIASALSIALFVMKPYWHSHESSWVCLVASVSCIHVMHYFRATNIALFLLSLYGGFFINIDNINSTIPFTLDDFMLYIHPIVLFLSYGYITVLWGGCIERTEVKHIAMTAWVLTTCAIGLGSFWAYYELGWGGFWSWDPVENLSAITWMTLTVVIHKHYNLAWVPFVSILIGTCLTRFSLLGSPHSFVINDGSALAMIMIVIFTLLYTYFCMRNDKIVLRASFVFLLFIAGLLFVASIVPLIFKFEIEEKLFNWIITPLLSIASSIKAIKQRNNFAISVSSIVAIALLYCGFKEHVFVVFFSIITILNFDRKFIAHIGFAIVLLGAVSTVKNKEYIVFLKKGEEIQCDMFNIKYESDNVSVDSSYRAENFLIRVSTNNRSINFMPQKRFYMNNNIKYNTSIRLLNIGIIHVRVGECIEGKIGIIIHYHPYIMLLWIGIIIMMCVRFMYI